MQQGNRRLPSAENVVDLIEAPVVRIASSRITIDGVPADLEAAQRILRNKRALWQPLNPGRRFPGVVLFEVERREHAGTVGRAVELSARAGFSQIGFVVRQREPRAFR